MRKPTFCVDCGTNVGPYEPSPSSLRATSLDTRWSHYHCETCQDDLVALCEGDTGKFCKDCQGINPFGSGHCAWCGVATPL